MSAGGSRLNAGAARAAGVCRFSAAVVRCISARDAAAPLRERRAAPA